MTTVSFDDKYVTLQLPSGKTSFHHIWLRDHCKCETHFHPVTKQRLQNTFDIPESVCPEHAILAPAPSGDDINLKIVWNHDDHQSTYPVSWLVAHAYNPPLQNTGYPDVDSTLVRTLWDPSQFAPASASEPLSLSTLPCVDYNEVMANDQAVAQWTKLIYQFGFCIVKNTPVSGKATESLIKRIAHIRHTHYGGFWEFTADMSHKDTAYTNMFLACHTDGTYFTEPPGLQLLHLLDHDGKGGETMLVDGFHAARFLKESDPKAYKTLSHVRIPAHAAGEETIFITPAQRFPVLVHDSDGNLAQIRWNNDDRSTMDKWESPEQVDEFYRAIRVWRRILEKQEIVFQLEPGSCLIFDNWRVLHGRHEFTGSRTMCGAYISRDDFYSRTRLLNLGRDTVLSEL